MTTALATVQRQLEECRRCEVAWVVRAYDLWRWAEGRSSEVGSSPERWLRFWFARFHDSNHSVQVHEAAK